MEIFHFSINVYINSYTAAAIARSHYFICNLWKKKIYLHTFIVYGLFAYIYCVRFIQQRTLRAEEQRTLTWIRC